MDMKIFGDISAQIHLFIHKLLLEKIIMQVGHRTKTLNAAVYFPEVGRNNLKSLSG